MFCLILVVKCGRILLINFSDKDDGGLECTFERTLSNEFSRTPVYLVGKQTTFTCRLKKAVTGWLKEQCHLHFNWVILITRRLTAPTGNVLQNNVECTYDMTGLNYGRLLINPDHVKSLTSIAFVSILVSLNGIFSGNFSLVIAT